MKRQIFPVVIGVIKKNGKYLLTKRQSPKKEWNKWQENNFSVRINSEASEYGWFSLREILKLDSLLGTKEIVSFIEENGF